MVSGIHSPDGVHLVANSIDNALTVINKKYYSHNMEMI